VRSYRTREDAVIRGGKDVWPCGADGKCRPCGQEIAYRREFLSGGLFEQVNWFCVHHKLHGCPKPKPDYTHDFGKRGHCLRCGHAWGWVDDTGTYYHTVEDAKLSRKKREQLKRPLMAGTMRTESLNVTRAAARAEAQPVPCDNRRTR
jgi:hypothetical protein